MHCSLSVEGANQFDKLTNDFSCKVPIENGYSKRSAIESMQIDTLSVSPDKNISTFQISGINTSHINKLRRIILSELPSLAFDQLLIVENTSILVDELLGQRIGLVLLEGPIDELEYTDDTKLMNDENTVLEFKLNVRCPSHLEKMTVTSEYIKWIPIGNQAQRFKTYKIGPIDKNIVITNLFPGQAINLSCFAIKGKSEIHVKWSLVSKVYYRPVPIIKFKNITGNLATTIKNICDYKVFDIEDGHLTISQINDCILCNQCVEVSDKNLNIKLNNKFNFTIESLGSVSAMQILQSAIQILISQL